MKRRVSFMTGAGVPVEMQVFPDSLDDAAAVLVTVGFRGDEDSPGCWLTRDEARELAEWLTTEVSR